MIAGELDAIAFRDARLRSQGFSTPEFLLDTRPFLAPLRFTCHGLLPTAFALAPRLYLLLFALKLAARRSLIVDAA